MRRLRLVLLLGLVTAAACQSTGYACSVDECKEGCQCASTKPPGGLAPQDTPQFILITNDDGVSTSSVPTIMQILGNFTNSNGCPIPATWFATAVFTEPTMVQQLYQGGHEIAVHTYNHANLADDTLVEREILEGREWLSNQTGIPLSKLNGFRAPYLVHSPKVRQTLLDNGFLYDSSMTEVIGGITSPDTAHRTWPYTLDEGIPQNCNTGKCVEGESYPGLFEVPLWAVHNADGFTPISAMDPAGDHYENYKRELDWRYNGNRAPLGVFLHAGLQTDPARIEGLHRFFEYALSLEHVWVVTNQQLLEWMKNPVKASEMEVNCEPPTDLDPSIKLSAGPLCTAFVGDCVYGTWSAANCRCACIGEGTPSGYSRDPVTGACTVFNAAQ